MKPNRFPVFVCLFVRYLGLRSGQAFVAHGGYHDLDEWHAVQADEYRYFLRSSLSDAPSVDPPAFELVMVEATVIRR